MHAHPPSPAALRDYLRWLALSAIGVLLLVAGLQGLTDPLGLFGTPRIAGLNAQKPYLDHHRELTRWTLARRACAPLGIFGNSRAEIGFDPESPVFAAANLSAFNHAIPGSGPDLLRQQLHWLGEAGCLPEQAIIGIDFFDFLGAAAPSSTRLSPPPALDHRVLAESVVSLSGLGDALATLALQHARHPAILTERGFNPLLNYQPEVARSGHYILFRQRAQENARNWSGKAKHLRPPGAAESAPEHALRMALASLKPGGKTVLVIYPYHAQIRLMMEQLGLSPLFAEWKRQMLALAESERRAGRPVEVWDFSGISSVTQEAIPTPGDRQTRLDYYWEAGHFKPALGERMLARLHGAPDDFGIRLEPAMLETWLAADAARSRALWQANGPLRREVDSLFAKPTQ